VHYNVNVKVKTSCQMLSGTDVSWGHDVRLGGSRWYGWWRGDCSIMSGPATEKTRLSNCVLLQPDRVVEERSWRTFESAEANREVPKTIADIDLAVEWIYFSTILDLKWSEIRMRISGFIRIPILMSAGSLQMLWIHHLKCRRQSFRRVSWKSAGDCMRNASTSPKISQFHNGEERGKVIRNPYPKPDHHQKLISSSNL